MTSRVGLHLVASLIAALGCSSSQDCKESGDGSCDELVSRVADATVVYLVERDGEVYVRGKAVPNDEVTAEIFALESRDDVSSASVSLPVQSFAGPAPNDPKFADNAWAFEATQFYLPDAPDAWGVSLGAGVQVGVLDDGLSRNRDVVAFGGWSMMYADIARTNGTDASTDADQYRSFGGEHGTWVAGLLSATMNNARAIAGAAPEASLVVIRVRERPGSIDLVKGIEQAALPESYGLPYEIQVLNISMGAEYGRHSPAVLTEMVEIALQNGLLVVASVGNHAQDGNPVVYPAGVPNVIGVGSVGNRPGFPASDFSERGFYVDIVAPGEELVTTSKPSFFHRYRTTVGSGTSFAAPLVAGAVALRISNTQGDCRVRESAPDRRACVVRLAQLVQSTALPNPGQGWTETRGAGLLQSFSLLTATEETAELLAPPGEFAVVGRVDDPSLGSSEVRVSWSVPVSGTADGYAVYRDGVRIFTTTETEFTDVLSEPREADLLYQVTAVNGRVGESFSPAPWHCSLELIEHAFEYQCSERVYGRRGIAR